MELFKLRLTFKVTRTRGYILNAIRIEASSSAAVHSSAPLLGQDDTSSGLSRSKLHDDHIKVIAAPLASLTFPYNQYDLKQV